MKSIMYDYIIVGAGVCGLSLAKELASQDKSVLILERGRSLNQNLFTSILYAASFYDKASFACSRKGVPLYRTFGIGGTGNVFCGNASRPSTQYINNIGIDLNNDIYEAQTEYKVRDNVFPLGKTSRKIMENADKLGYSMKPMPKFSTDTKCSSCGKCVLGCKYNSKWSAKHLVGEFSDKITIVSNMKVIKVITQSGNAIGVSGNQLGFKKKYFAKKVVLAAGGLGTPVILQKNGIDAGKNLFVDLFTQTYGIIPDSLQNKEHSMSAVCDIFHDTEGFILSPFIDTPVSLYPLQKFRFYRHLFKMSDLAGIMTKISDDNTGRVYPDGRVDKAPSPDDLRKLNAGNAKAKEILISCGADPNSVFCTKPRGAHPGGTAAIGAVINKKLETEIKNLYVCDASAIPQSPGLPPVLLLLGLTKYFTRIQSDSE